MHRLRIAVIGSGISGLCAAWLLSQRHDVVVVEADARLGGHAHTVDVTVEKNAPVAVDTGFIVSNTWTYPNFAALMDYLDTPMVETEMGFSVSMDNGRYEYSGNSFGTLFGPPAMWCSPSHLRMISDLVRFYRTAEKAAPAVPEHVTLGDYLKANGYGEAFVRRHILPMAGAIWSSTPDEIAAYPFRAFVNFFANHRLFELGDRKPWRTVKGGSREYVRRLVDDARFETRLSAPVERIMRRPGAVDVLFGNGGNESFDHVVLATHADQSLRLLGNPTADEIALLTPFKTSLNRVYLHRDPTLMPKSRHFWAGWNYMGNNGGRESKLAVTYWMNALQKLDSPAQHFVSLNPQTEPSLNLLDGRYQYRHPIFTAVTLEAQKHLWSLQGVNRTWFAGAWFGSGFHEDGAQAGLAVAEQLGGVPRPWSVPDPSGRIHVRQPLPLNEAPMVDAAE